MKQVYRFLTGLLLLFGPAARAQDTDSLRQALDHLFAPLDKTQVPVPYLAEYGNRFTSLAPFNGTLTDSSTTTLTAWRLLYASVLSGNVGRPSPLPPLPDLNAALAAQVAATPTAIPLLVQHLPYASLRPDARTAGLLTAQNGQLYDVANRPASPYVQHTLFAAAPARSSSPTGNVSFVFMPGLHVHAGGTGTGNVSSLSLDFGDGRGYVAAAWKVPVSAKYCSPGTKRVKVRIAYSPGTVVESWFDLHVQEAECVAYRYDETDVAELQQPFPAVSGVHSGGRVFVRFGGNRVAGDQTIRRPLIVAEGYDGFSVAPAVYGSNYGVQDFINDIVRAEFNFTNLNNALEQAPGGFAGYDIIFLDYANGTDDIRRNAALFEEVVRWVNRVKAGGIASGEPNVVLGVSMGGLVARYGLAEMIKNPQVPNNAPHTRLLVTHDSPHRGANTPLGIQMLTRQAAGTNAGQSVRFYNGIVTIPLLPQFFSNLALFPELQQADNLLDAPATRQLLLVRGLRFGTGRSASFSAEYNSFLDNDYRNMITMAPGQPFPRFIATSLGSQCGTGLFAPHTELVRVERRGYLGVIGLTTGYKTEIIVNAMPSGGRVERISSMRVWNETRVLGLSTGRVYLTNYVYHSPASNPIAWDGLPGGTQPVRTDNLNLPQGSSYFDRLELVFVWGSSANTYLADNFCFVPRFSALDVPTFDQASLTGPYVNDAAAGGAPRAERFIAQASFFNNGTKFNRGHPFFPGRQAQWIFNEMQQPITGAVNAAGCSTECATPNAITGSNSICRGGEATFSLQNLLPGTSVQWSVSPAGAVTPVGSSTGSTFTVSAPASGQDGQVTIQAQVGPCGPPITRTVPITSGFVGLQTSSGGQDVCISTTVTVQATTFGGASVSNWRVDNGQLLYVSGDEATVQVSSSPGITTVHADYTTSCPGSSGSSSSTSADIYVVDNQNGFYCVQMRVGDPKEAVYPNPADAYLNIRSPFAAARPFRVELRNDRGRLVHGLTARESALQVDTQRFPAGLYHLTLRQGNESVNYNISIQH